MTLQQIYAQAPILVWIGVVVLGLLIGSFLNVVIYRLPKMMHIQWRRECEEFLENNKDNPDTQLAEGESFNLATPNSRCPKCNSAIKPWQNIPVLSYLFLKGRCANCAVKISPRYPIIEAVAGALGALVLWSYGANTAGCLGLILVWALLCLTMIDIDHYLLPDSITLPLMWLGILANIWATYTDLQSAVIGAMVGYLSLWSVYWLFKLTTGKEGMGFGDFKLLAALGAWMGWQYLLLIILLSSLVGAILGVAGILLLGRDKAKPLPFGPYLAIAGLAAFIWGEQILHFVPALDLTRAY